MTNKMDNWIVNRIKFYWPILLVIIAIGVYLNTFENRLNTLEAKAEDIMDVPTEISELKTKTDLTNQSVSDIKTQLSELKQGQKDQTDLLFKILNLLK